MNGEYGEKFFFFCSQANTFYAKALGWEIQMDVQVETVPLLNGFS